MRQFYTLYSQVIDVSEENKIKEIEAFIKKYHLDYKRSAETPKSKPIWELFVIFAIIHTVAVIGMGYISTLGWKIDDLLWGYGFIAVLYVLSYFATKFQDHNIKVN